MLPLFIDHKHRRLAACALATLALAGCKSDCFPGFIKVQDQCVPYDLAKGYCAKVCEQLQCGDDGCGGSCGTCNDKSAPFCVNGMCAAECVVSCEGKVCGDDGCGGSCGTCDGVCSPKGNACAPSAFACQASVYADGSACHCGCGAPDPDCEDKTKPVVGCENLGATCDAAGSCVGGVGDAWVCPAALFNDGRVCNCGCGAVDPDCVAIAGATVVGCEAGEVCGAQGTCEAACTPNCTGKACGDDGCGRQCGACPDEAAYCNAGVCSATCAPNCDGRSCGDNGCGGVCGTCAVGQLCRDGQCDATPAELSCVGKCGGQADDGCSCAPSCVADASCCPDAEVACGCFPKCTNKSCGDDGCGASCGTCESGQLCTANQQCVDDPCLPDPCSGHGTCASLSGACTCATGYAGMNCAACADGYTGYPTCVVDLCEADTCSFHGVCDSATGGCTCDPGFAGAQCDGCLGLGVYPSCL